MLKFEDMHNQYHLYLSYLPADTTLIGDALERTREWLTDYYNSPKGQEEIARSPHAEKSADEIVSLLIQDIETFERKEVERRVAGGN